MTEKIYSIQRSDGLGSHLCRRLYAEEFWSRPNVPGKYVHTKLEKITHLSHIKSDDDRLNAHLFDKKTWFDWNEYIDHIWMTYTGKENSNEAELHDNVLELQSIPLELRFGLENKQTGKTMFSNRQKNGEIRYHNNLLFTSKLFSNYKDHFIEHNKSYMLYDDKTFNVIMHIRRGDIVRLMKKKEERWRKQGNTEKPAHVANTELEYFEDICKTIIDMCKERKVTPQFYIETDSPHLVTQLATKIDARVNVTTEFTENQKKNPLPSMPSEEYIVNWEQHIITVQSMYNLCTADLFIPSWSGYSEIALMIGNDVPTIMQQHCGGVKTIDKIEEELSTNRNVLNEFRQSVPEYIKSLNPTGAEKIPWLWKSCYWPYVDITGRLGSPTLPSSVSRTIDFALNKKVQR